MGREVVLSTGDATVARYTVEFDVLVIELTVWDGARETIGAEGVTHLEDSGTWECDALVRVAELDAPDGSRGYGIASVEGTVTLSFRAKGLTVGGHPYFAKPS